MVKQNGGTAIGWDTKQQWCRYLLL